MDKAVLFRKEAGAASIVINRPEKRNALNMAVASEVVACLKQCEDDPQLRVITLTGAGDVAFCAGNDLAEFQARGDDQARMREFDQAVVRMHESIRKCRKVVVAIVNGYCLGGGITLLGACDLALASDRAEFGLPEVAKGIWPAMATTTVMHHLHRKHALYLILTGKRISAGEAVNVGLINRVVPHDQLASAAAELVQEMTRFDPMVLEWGKRMADESTKMEYGLSLDHGLSASALFRAINHSFAEGRAAFLNKK
jgi:enoyl-CoA hydratase/carnithine racemase